MVLLLVLVFTTPFATQKKLDERITLRQKDKIPYGTYVAYQLLPSLFPNATISTNKLSPLDWAFDTVRTSGQALFITARIFDPEVHEIMRMIRFVERGNYVFIMANGLSAQASEYFEASASGIPFNTGNEDTLKVQLSSPPFEKKGLIYIPVKNGMRIFPYSIHLVQKLWVQVKRVIQILYSYRPGAENCLYI